MTLGKEKAKAQAPRTTHPRLRQGLTPKEERKEYQGPQAGGYRAFTANTNANVHTGWHTPEQTHTQKDTQIHMCTHLMKHTQTELQTPDPLHTTFFYVIHVT